MIRDIDKTIEAMEMAATVKGLYDPMLHYDGNAQEIRDFVRYCVNNAQHYRIDILTGIARQSTGMLLSDVLDKVDDKSHTGLKVVYKPIIRINEWEKWDDGYIEGCLRTMTSPDYFVWSYIPMSRLKATLLTHQDKLRLL